MSVELCHGWAKRPVQLSATRLYYPEQIEQICDRLLPPLWLRIGDRHIRVEDPLERKMAYAAAAAYHESIASSAAGHDGFEEEMAEIERDVLERMSTEAH